MEFRILGLLDVVAGARTIELGATKERTILGVLLLSANRAVSVEQLSDALWGNRTTGRSLGTLRAHVSFLRKALRSVSEPGRELLVTRNPGYMITIESDELDSTRFEALVAGGRARLRASDPEGAAGILRGALSLWRGPVLDDLGLSPAEFPEIARLSEARVAAIEDRVEADLACGRHHVIVGEIEALVAEHPLRERLWSHRMLALYRAGRQADALRAYQQLRRLLAEELGIEPGPDLRRLEEAILLHDPQIGWRSSGAATTSRPAPMPTGVVTLLLTDIEGSDQTWDAEPAEMAEAVLRHQQVVAEAVTTNAGMPVRIAGVGHGAGAVFNRASDAVSAAIALSTALDRERWPGGRRLRGRVVVHVGEVEAGENEYAGPTVSRAEMIKAIGHGGQVLLSQTAAELARDSLPDRAGLRDLGAHRLRDFTRPERIWQLTHPDLEADFGRLRSLDARLTNLPVESNSFVGRTEELERVADLLTRSRLLTLTGAGGSGKTRLARQAAAAAIDQYPDGVWLAELAPIVRSDLVPSAVAAALNVAEQPGREPLDTLLGELAHKRLLIVLDNCEHLLIGAAALCASLLAAGDGIHILATSRERLAITGESAWPVPPLVVPADDGDADALAEVEAVALFVDRAVAAVPSFTLSRENRAAVANICIRLDGIPLALELAAARVNVLSPGQLSERLDDRFRLLSSGRRDVVPRHQTLAALVDWSYDLLSDEERLVLHRLSVFRGGFTLDAAEAVCAAPPLAKLDIFIPLAQLVDKSLVQVTASDEGARYGLLETIREYAAARLEHSGESEATRTRHLDWYLQAAKAAQSALEGPGAEASLRHLTHEHQNLRMALETASNEPATLLALASFLAPFWLAKGYWREGRSWLAAAVEPGERLARGRALTALGQFETYVGEQEAGSRYLRTAVSELRADGDRDGLISALRYLGHCLMRQGHLDVAMSTQEEGLTIARELAAPQAVAVSLDGMSETAWRKGDFEATCRFQSEALELYRRTGDRRGQAHAMNGFGRGCVALGRIDAANQNLGAALDLFRELEDPFGIALTSVGLGRSSLAANNFSGACEWLKGSLAGFLSIGDRRGQIHSVHDLGIVALASGQPERAVRLLAAADRAFAGLGFALTAFEEAEDARLLAEARQILGDETLRWCWADGGAMEFGRALEQASEVTCPGPPSSASPAQPERNLAG